MEILDINGKKIREGLYVKYTGTHTIGKVDKIRLKKEMAWIRLDSNGLYYRNDYIEVIDGKNSYINPKKVNRAKSEKFDIQIPVEISDSTDGPGVGGG